MEQQALPAPQPQDLAFWADIFSDHAKFVRQQLNPDHPSAEEVTRQLFLIEDFFNGEKTHWIEQRNAVINEPLSNFLDQAENLNTIIGRLNKLLQNEKLNKIPLGHLYPSFLVHMVEEYELFTKIINGQYSLSDLAVFLPEHNKEVNLLSQHLLDPVSTKLIAALQAALARDLKEVPTVMARITSTNPRDQARLIDALIGMAQNFINDNKVLLANLKLGQPLSVDLVVHEAKENEYLIRKLEQLKNLLRI